MQSFFKMLTVEKYNPTDKNDCNEIFKSNIPDFFSQLELTGFKNWLDKNDCPDFYILKNYGQIIGFGGFYFENGQARLVYGIIDREHQNIGHGKFLTDYRINKIREKDRGIPIGLETTQLTNKFFEKFGFKTIEILPNYYYDRFDKYEMILQSDIDKKEN